MVRFDDQPSSPQADENTGADCFGTELALAVRENINHLKDFTEDSASSGVGSSNYIPAFEKAFSYFKPDLAGGAFPPFVANSVNHSAGKMSQ